MGIDKVTALMLGYCHAYVHVQACTWKQHWLMDCHVHVHVCRCKPEALGAIMADHTQLDWRPVLPLLKLPCLNLVGGCR